MPTVTRLPVSALVPCFNNEDVIEACLQSVRWADEVIVCDSFSSDGTIDVARRYADRVVQHEYKNSAIQKNWVIPQATHEWILIVDTDERVTASLRSEIEHILTEGPNYVGYRIPRANHIFGRQLKNGGSWPDYQLRLFRRDLGRYETREVHAHVILDGSVGTLEFPLIHFPHRSLGNLRRVILQRYTTWEAMERDKRGIRFRWYQPIVRPPSAFVYRYIIRRGYRDGWQGLLWALVWACYVFITHIKLRQIQRGNRT